MAKKDQKFVAFIRVEFRAKTLFDAQCKADDIFRYGTEETASTLPPATLKRSARVEVYPVHD